MIEIDSLTVSYGGVKALWDVSLTMDAKVYGIIGPNGAGKTTFLNVMSGFAIPQSGQITAQGQSILSLSPHLRARWGLRRSFQKEQIVGQLSVEENILVVLDQLRMSRSERMRFLDSAIEFTGLSKVRREKTEKLSSLQRRLTEVARCVAGTPHIVMLDEPGAGFSQQEVSSLRDIILSIHEYNGAMTLLIDHDVDLIKATCNKTMVLDFGQLVCCGDTIEVLNDDRVRAVYLGVEEF